MVDTFSKEKRHEIMSNIKSNDSKPEIKVRKYLYAHNIRYRKNYKDILGKPDIVINKYKIAIFIHGCFWHGHENCKYYRLPKSNIDYWKNKLEKNIQRDKITQMTLEAEGWHVFIIWECEVKHNFSEISEDLKNNIIKIIKEKK